MCSSDLFPSHDSSAIYPQTTSRLIERHFHTHIIIATQNKSHRPPTLTHTPTYTTTSTSTPSTPSPTRSPPVSHTPPSPLPTSTIPLGPFTKNVPTPPSYSHTHTHIHYYVHIHTFYSLSDTLSHSTSHSTITTSDVYHTTRSFY